MTKPKSGNLNVQVNQSYSTSHFEIQTVHILCVCVCMFVVVHSPRGHEVSAKEKTLSAGTACQTQGKVSQPLMASIPQ